MSIIGARIVKMPDGHQILQLQRQWWGPEENSWITPTIVDFESLSSRAKEAILKSIGELPG